MKESGKIFYVDAYGQQYNVEWRTVSNQLDVTTVVKIPFVYGEKQDGYISNGYYYKRGIIITDRKVFSVDDGSVIAEGNSESIDFFKTNFKVTDGLPSDDFDYHYNNAVSDEVFVNIAGEFTNIDDLET